MSSLSNKALLTTLRISQWTARRLDRRETGEVAARNNADPGVARVNKALLPGAASLEAVVKKSDEIRRRFRLATLPWGESDMRILKSDGYLDFTQAMRAQISDWKYMVDRFVSEYPRLVTDVACKLGSLYDPNDYPHQDNIRNKFDIALSFSPVPSAEDWRVSLSEAEVEDLRKQVEEDTKRAQSIAMREAWQRLHDCVRHAVEKLRDPEAIFRDSLVRNAEDLCRVLPVLNIADDPHLEQMRQELEASLCGIDPKDLRKYPDFRQKTADRVQDILDKLGGFYQDAT
jgi:hypothetical protein